MILPNGCALFPEFGRPSLGAFIRPVVFMRVDAARGAFRPTRGFRPVVAGTPHVVISYSVEEANMDFRRFRVYVDETAEGKGFDTEEAFPVLASEG